MSSVAAEHLRVITDRPPNELLRRPASEVARLLARRQLDHWVEARARLDRKDNPEALHGFRVALRRLRSVLRAFRPQLEERVSRRTWRRLGRLADATSESRNLEVECAWVQKALGRLVPADRVGAQQLLARLEGRRQAAERRVHREVAKWFAPLKRKLRQGLAESTPPAAERNLTAGAVMRRAVRREAAELERHLAAIHAVPDREAAHGARISAKRLRYLLEPFEQGLPEGTAVVEDLTALQDILGELQDTHVVADELCEALGEGAAQRARRVGDDVFSWGGTAGSRQEYRPEFEAAILALARRLRRERDGTFEKLRGEWLQGKAALLLARLTALGEHHQPSPRPASTVHPALAAEGRTNQPGADLSPAAGVRRTPGRCRSGR